MKLLLSRVARVVLSTGEFVELAPRDAALLAWLALEGATPRTRLAGLLWPEKDTEAARNSLRQRLHQLHKVLGTRLIHGESTISLVEGVSHDLHDADTVLEDVANHHGVEFNSWLTQQRDRRRSRKRLALSDLADRAEQAQDHADAMVHAEELLALEPHSEAAHRRVIRLHYLRGDRAAALLAFDRCERVLKDDVGATPSRETLSLLATIERAAPDAALQPTLAVPAALQRPPRLIGRDAERQMLARAADDGAVVLLTGQAGMGKSRLIDDVVGRGAPLSGALPRHASVCARPGDTAVPYAIAARWLRGFALRADLALDDVQRRALTCVLPELGLPMSRGRQDGHARVLAALHGLLDAAHQRGLRAVVVDDFQYADAASAELLGALAGNTRCGWIFATRPDELSLAARVLFDAQAALTTTITVALQPLAVEAIAALLDSLALVGIGGMAQAEALHQRTGGNPMFLLETLKAALATRAAAAQPGSDVDTGKSVAWPRAASVLRLIQQRLMRLDPLALKLARCAALAGQDFSSSLAAEVLGLQPLDLADAWLALEEAQVLHGGVFAHDLIAEAALGLVPAPIARALHAEIGRILERGSGEPARIAAHWIAAGEPQKAAPHLTAAARRAQAASQRAEAALLHAQAAVILRDAGDRRGAFDAYFAAAEAASQSVGRHGFAAYGAALQELADDDGQRAAATLVPAAILLEQRQLDAVRALALKALDRAQRANLPDVEVELLWDLILVHMDRREMAEAGERIEQALARLADVNAATARLTHLGTRFKLTQALGMVLSATGQYGACTALLVQSLERARSDHEWAYTGFLANALANNAIEQGELAQALHWSAQAIADDDRYDGGIHERVTVGSDRALLMALGGDLGGALAAAEGAVRLCESHVLRAETRTRLRLHSLQFELGRRDLALKGLRALRGQAGLRTDEQTMIEGELLRMGDAADVSVLLDQAMAIDDFPLRVRMLCLLQPACPPVRILPLLSTSAAAARSHGAHGLWLSLQTCRIATLRTAQCREEAQAQALAVWQRVEDGIAGLEMFPRVAVELYGALVDGHADLAQVIALRASAWMQQAAATLPAAWRANYLTRAPVLQGLQPVVGVPSLSSQLDGRAPLAMK